MGISDIRHRGEWATPRSIFLFSSQAVNGSQTEDINQHAHDRRLISAAFDSQTNAIGEMLTAATEIGQWKAESVYRTSSSYLTN